MRHAGILLFILLWCDTPRGGQEKKKYDGLYETGISRHYFLVGT